MPERTVAVGLTADVSNYIAGMTRASSATAGVGKQAQTTGEQTRAFVGKIGGSISSLGNQIGGTVGVVLSQLGNDIDTVSSKAVRLSTALEVGGGAAVAAGLGLQQLGSGAVEATNQLSAAITASGDSVSDYSKRIDDVVASNENLGRSAEDTKGALTALIPAAGSTSKALDQMQVVTDLAAARHEDLTTAATAVARVLGGNGSRTLSVYGIQMDGVGTKVQQGTRALAELEDKLSGQASASVNTFSGQIGIATTHVKDFIEEAAGPAGTALEALGVLANVAGAAIDFYRLRQDRAKDSTIAATAANAASTTGLEGEAAAADTAAVSMDKVSGAAGLLKGGVVGLAAVLGLDLVTAWDRAGDAAQNNTIKFANAAAASAAINKQAQLNAGAGIESGPKGTSSEDIGYLIKQTTGGQRDLNNFFQTYKNPVSDFSQQLLGATGNFDSINKIDSALASLVTSGHAAKAKELFDQYSAAAVTIGVSSKDAASDFPAYKAALDGVASSTSNASDKTQVLGDSFNAASVNAAQLKATTAELEKGLSSYGSTTQSAESATEGWYSSLDAANKSIQDNGKNIDDSTVKGRANNQTLYALATAADTLAAANLKAKVPIDQVKASLDAQRQTFITTAEQMGYTADAATALAAKLIGVTTTKYNFELDGVTVATNSLNAYITALGKIPGKITTSIQVTPGSRPVIHTGGFIDKNGVGHFASGGGYGQYQGPGSGTSDSIPAMVSNGEYINSAATVSRLGVGYFQKLNQGGTPAPVYQQAPAQAVVHSQTLSVSVPISQSLVGDDAYIAKVVTAAVTKAVNSGVVSAGWNKH